jgi:hypothetical protein
MPPTTRDQVAPKNGTDPADEEPQVPGTAGPDSLLEELRSKREAISEERRHIIEIPGYGGRLAARYRAVSWREMRKGARKIREASADVAEAEVNLAAAALVRCCDCIMVRKDDGGPLIPLNEAVASFGDEPVRYDERLATALDIETEAASKPTAIVRMVFKNQYALISHSAELDQWLKESSDEDDEDF